MSNVSSPPAPTSSSAAAANPLLTAWDAPFETPPFDQIRPEHFPPAYAQAFADHAAEIAAMRCAVVLSTSSALVSRTRSEVSLTMHSTPAIRPSASVTGE